MKFSGKTLFRLAVVSFAFLLAVQVPAIGASRPIYTGFVESSASIPDAPAAVVLVPVNTGKAVAVQTAVFAAEPAALLAEIQTQKIATIAAAETVVTAEPAVQETEAAEPQLILPGVLYDAEQNIYFGPNGKGLLYIGFDYDADQKLFYSSVNCWQKAFGFNDLYEALAPLGAMIFDTRSIYFTYDGLDWMVKLWKGQYGITSGAELGIYTKSSIADSHYIGVDEENFMLMDMKVLRHGEPYFTREAQMHWWLSGFVLGDITAPDELNLESSITFKDRAMTKAFIAALGGQAQADTEDVVCVDNGTCVTLSW